LKYIDTLRIKTPSAEQKVVYLSGGNQQKVVISKWITRKPKILIVDEPTKGIDVGAKAEVHALLTELASEGIGIIMVSSELPEIIAMSDRVIVIKEGQIAGEFSRSEANQEVIMEAATCKKS
jgi:ribose transport system ATP-binding protein